MKRLVFELKDDLLDLSFPEKLIKGRKEILLIIMEACRSMIFNNQVANADKKFMLVVNEMNRLFFCMEKKMFSVMFPFHVEEYPSVRFDYERIPIDSKMISHVVNILESEDYDNDDAMDFIAPISVIQEQYNKDFWHLMHHLMTYEIGYVRYDDDIDGFEKASKLGMPKHHPRYHYDINMGSQATFKIGLPKQVKPDNFVDLMDNKKDRLILKQ